MSKLALGKWYLFRDEGIYFLTCTDGYNAEAPYVLESPEGVIRRVAQEMMNSLNPIEIPISDKAQLMFLDGLLREMGKIRNRAANLATDMRTPLAQSNWALEEARQKALIQEETDIRVAIQLLVHKVHMRCAELTAFENEERMSPVLRPGGGNG